MRFLWISRDMDVPPVKSKARRPPIKPIRQILVVAPDTLGSSFQSSIVRPAAASITKSVALPAIPAIPSALTPAATAPAIAPATATIKKAPQIDLSPEAAPTLAAGPSLTVTPKLTQKSKRVLTPMIDDSVPILSPAEYGVGEQSVKARLTKRIGMNPSERPFVRKDLSGNPIQPIFTPISSPKFRDFIIQAYAQYSPAIKSILDKKDPAAIEQFIKDIQAGKIDTSRAPKKINQEACKMRSSVEIEMFYYQKFVRDYLQRGSPYRGLLVYHGLGTGKTCTSIAAAEALHWGNLKKIYVLTPATLSNNYRKDLGKCGFFPLRAKNYWTFFPVKAQGPQYVWLEKFLGLPTKSIIRQGGAWIPDPDKPSNWLALSESSRNAIRQQQQEHMDHRFTFIHYNGASKDTLSIIAEDGLYPSFILDLEIEYSKYKRGDKSGLTMIQADGKINGFIQEDIRLLVSSAELIKKLRISPVSDEFIAEIKREIVSRMFDDSVVIIDEVHNLVRTIAGVKIGQLNLAKIIDDLEPHQYNWSTPIRKITPGFVYPRGYSLYRMLQNAVGCKIIGLSATPMINYAHEMAILMNIIAGEQRSVNIPLRGVAAGKENSILPFLIEHPKIDYYNIKKDTNVLTITPVPSGFIKVVEKDESGSPVFRGFVRPPPWPMSKQTTLAKDSNERNIEAWGKSIVADLVAKGILQESVEITDHTYPHLPEEHNEFVSNFIQKESLQIMNPNVLKARTLGYVSYYKGQSEELMPRGIEKEIVLVPMSDHMFVEYLRVRNAEIDRDKKKASVAPQKQVGPINLYAQATKVLQTGFMARSRAACNFTFPEGIVRPVFASLKQEVQVLGLEPVKVIAVDRNVELAKAKAEAESKAKAKAKGKTTVKDTATDADDEEYADDAVDAVDEEGPGIEEEDEEGGEAVAKTVAGSQAVIANIQSVMDSLESVDNKYLTEGLATFSPKYFVMIENISRSSGPVLVYSQFKTLEGLGIFSAALRASKNYIQLDIVRTSGEWEIPAESMDPSRPKFIIYSGDQDLEKRRLLLQLYNADLASLPTRLAEQCRELLGDATDNRDGRICKVFMITQSGAEGISLMNTRQVHLMEPYWNNVRRQQVIGRAIRLCSHMNLPWDDRVVEIYTYLSVLTPEQKRDPRTSMIMTGDGGLTTDEMIYSIAVNKQKLADGIQGIFQSAAVDCELHIHEHSETSSTGEVTQCFRIGSEHAPAFLTSPDWHEDLVSIQLRDAGKSKK